MSDLPCIECKGTCCKSHSGVMLDDGSTLWFINDRCPHLTSDDRCGIYETRPKSCRAFDCSKEAGFRRIYPQVAALLTLRNIPLSPTPPPTPPTIPPTIPPPIPPPIPLPTP